MGTQEKGRVTGPFTTDLAFPIMAAYHGWNSAKIVFSLMAKAKRVSPPRNNFLAFVGITASGYGTRDGEFALDQEGIAKVVDGLHLLNLSFSGLAIKGDAETACACSNAVKIFRRIELWVSECSLGVAGAGHDLPAKAVYRHIKF